MSRAPTGSRALLRAAGCVLAVLVASCASLPSWFPGSRAPTKLDAERVPGAIEAAEQDLAAGRTQRALDWMRSASRSTGLSSDTRQRVQELLERAARTRMDDLSAPGSDPEDLADMLDIDLPRQIAVAAGVRAARRMHELGEPMDAYRLLKKIDTRFPLHHERVAAGDLLFEIGESLSRDTSSFLGFFRKSDDAQEVLEYLVLYYPWTSTCDRAYEILARIYEEESEWDFAIERHEKLVLNHPGSPLRAASQARIPHLRLRSLRSPEYDRSQLVQAERELVEWLRAFAGHEREADVRVDLADCLRRLSDSDMVIARFYERVDNAFGARFHAVRAADEARRAGDEERAREADELASAFPPNATEAVP